MYVDIRLVVGNRHTDLSSPPASGAGVGALDTTTHATVPSR